MYYEEFKDKKDDVQPKQKISLNDCHLSSVRLTGRIFTDMDGGRHITGEKRSPLEVSLVNDKESRL